jgi:hypothetical protein
MLGDSILKAFERGLLDCFGRGGIGKSEDVLGEREQRILRILGIGTHFEVWREKPKVSGCIEDEPGKSNASL